MNSDAGQIFDVFTSEEVESWINVLKKAPPVVVGENMCHGVDEKHILNPWFHKKIFSKIKTLFGDDLNLIFGMVLNENAPWKIHTDSYHCHGFNDRIPALSILIPYSVDNNRALVEETRTIVFNEKSDTNKLSREFVEDRTKASNSAADIYHKHLSHNPIDIVNKLTVQGVYQWKANSVIYWDSFLLHDSDNFHKNGYQSKQAIVIHTYRQK